MIWQDSVTQHLDQQVKASVLVDGIVVFLQAHGAYCSVGVINDISRALGHLVAMEGIRHE